MKNSIKKDNKLINRKSLVLLLKNHGINRVSPDALIFIETYLNSHFKKIIPLLKEEMLVKGKRTLQKRDIDEVLTKEENYWEI